MKVDTIDPDKLIYLMNESDTTPMNRRTFTKTAVTATAAAATLSTLKGAHHEKDKMSSENKPFTMRFGPHDGHFREHVGNNVLDQIQFAYDHGFRTWEDNRMPRREVSEQVAMGKLFEKLGMELGVFVAYAEFRHPTMTGHRADFFDRKRDKKEIREMLIGKMKDAVEIAKRGGTKYCTVVPGSIDPSVLPEYQTANVVEHLKYMAEICEPSGLVMVLEPLNYINHPNCFLQRVAQAHQICAMVDSPSCKILDDLYHQQITEGNLITNMEDAWDQIAYIQVGDVPGRKEPTTGEINYKNVFKWLYEKGYQGIIGMEHGIKNRGTKEGEMELIKAYRSVDVS